MSSNSYYDLNLPCELEVNVLSHLSSRVLLDYSQVNSKCNKLILDDPFWNYILPIEVPKHQTIRDTIIDSRDVLKGRLKQVFDNLGFNQRLQFECILQHHKDARLIVKVVLVDQPNVFLRVNVDPQFDDPSKPLTQVKYFFTKKLEDLPDYYQNGRYFRPDGWEFKAGEEYNGLNKSLPLGSNTILISIDFVKNNLIDNVEELAKNKINELASSYSRFANSSLGSLLLNPYYHIPIAIASFTIGVLMSKAGIIKGEVP